MAKPPLDGRWGFPCVTEMTVEQAQQVRQWRMAMEFALPAVSAVAERLDSSDNVADLSSWPSLGWGSFMAVAPPKLACIGDRSIGLHCCF